MPNYLAMTPQQCQEASCKIVYRCNIETGGYVFQKACKPCTFDSNCDIKAISDVQLPEFSICQTCYQHLMEAD